MKLLRRLIIALGSAVVVLGGIGLWLASSLTGPGPARDDRTVIIARGGGTGDIAQRLAEAGVIDHPAVFVFATAVSAPGRSLKAGEYLIPAHASAAEIVALLQGGHTVKHKLTVPEGLTSAQVTALLKAEPALTGVIDAPPAEGSLFPDTYFFAYGDSRAELVARMQAAMTAVVAELWARRAPDLPLTSPGEAVTLASIVEKETAIKDERPLIAGVFLNRLGHHMRLQSDPTVIYALNNGAGPLGRPLTRADWKVESRYNTYGVDGLPPGPIGNPGRAALEAAMRPEKTGFLYFVADGGGRHSFSDTLIEHNKVIARLREERKDTGTSGAVAEPGKTGAE